MWFDAHNHLQAEQLNGVREAVQKASDAGEVTAVVNGTHPGDWAAVLETCGTRPDLIPALGLHPWWVNEAPENWLSALEELLDKTPRAQVGEIGLDRWKTGFDPVRQEEAFRAQMHVALERGRTPSIHCLRAWGALLELLQNMALPPRGFLLHAYGGPAEMVPTFVQLGAYFSWSGSFAHPQNERKRRAFEAVPLDRLLMETDAPDMLGPSSCISHPWTAPESAPCNHPLNIDAITRDAAGRWGLALEDFTARIRENFQRLFSRPG